MFVKDSWATARRVDVRGAGVREGEMRVAWTRGGSMR